MEPSGKKLNKFMDSGLSQESHNEESEVRKRIDLYIRVLGLAKEDMHERITLEIGAGQAEFASAARKKGFEVHAVDAHPEIWAERGGVPNEDWYQVSPAENLPYADEQFDLLISHAAPPTISQNREEIEAVISEAMRVLKEGGEFRFGPTSFLAQIVSEGKGPIFTEQDFETMTMEERNQRLRDMSYKWLKKQYPEVQQVLTEDGANYYSLRKRADLSQ